MEIKLSFSTGKEIKLSNSELNELLCYFKIQTFPDNIYIPDDYLEANTNKDLKRGVFKMDKKEIVGIAREQGLELAEDTALAAAKTAINLLKVILPKVSKGFGLAFVMFMDAYEGKIFELIDKIDGEQNLG